MKILTLGIVKEKFPGRGDGVSAHGEQISTSPLQQTEEETMIQRIQRFRLGTYAPWTIAVAILAIALAIGFPQAAYAKSQGSGQQAISQTLGDGTPPDIGAMAMTRIDQQVFYDDTGTYDTSQIGALALYGGSGVGTTGVCAMTNCTATAFYDGQSGFSTSFYDDTGASGATTNTVAHLGHIPLASIDDGSRGSPPTS